MSDPVSASNGEPLVPSTAVQFARFAPYYDKFMARYVNYRSWAQYVLKLFRHYRVRPELVLDLACGTGVPTLLLARAGYRVIGVDRSEAMLAVLRSKVGSFPISVLQADMRDFRLPEPADAAISLYDSINYLLTRDDLERCFRAVSRNLKPGSLFIFDMNTAFGLATYWGNRTTVREVGDIHSIWRTHFDAETGISSLHLTFQVTEGGTRVRYDEVHEERGYATEEVTRSLQSAGFDRPDIYDHGTLRPPSPTASRVMFVARKQA
jgi:SAM-dependent methyltransferase